jgi:hypothetical protein
MSTTTTTGLQEQQADGLGARVVAAIFDEVDRRRAAKELFTRDTIAPHLVAIVEREAREYVQGKPAAKPGKPRNALLDAFATIGGGKLDEITKTAWPGFAKRLQEIKEVSPDVTVEELHARAEVYQKRFPQATLTPHALAKHWGELGHAVKVEVVRDYSRI